MELNTLWFILVAVLFTGFFFLEGFDYGVGILMPFVGRNRVERRLAVSAIGPFWDANEVWMILAVGATFAVFPNWYASMFSGFYLLMAAILFTIILRGVAFEFRNRSQNRTWQTFWDAMIFVGSLSPAFIWGLSVTNLIKGVPLNEKGVYTGSLTDLLSPYALLGGAAFVAIFMLNGAIFLTLKTTGRVLVRAKRAAAVTWVLALLLVGVHLVMGYLPGGVYAGSQLNPWFVSVAVLAALVGQGLLLARGRYGVAFALNALAIGLMVANLFVGLFPRLMVSSLNPEWSLTIYNSAATDKSLTITTWLSLTLLPVIIAYQAWNYYIFRKRVTVSDGHHI